LAASPITFDVPDHGILQFFRRHECLSALPDEAGYPVAALQHVMKV
jgi:hypothetical protein